MSTTTLSMVSEEELQERNARLRQAIAGESLEAVKAAVAEGADVNGRDDDDEHGGEAMLHKCASLASHDKAVEIAAFLLDTKRVPPRHFARTATGVTPLHLACFEQNRALVALFLEHGADVDAKDADGATPLAFCAFNGDVETAKLLLAQKADVNARMRDGSSILSKATQNTSHAAFCAFLMQNGADIHAKDDTGMTPAMAAATCGAVECLKVLVEGCGRFSSLSVLNDTDNAGHNVERIAHESKRMDVLQYLVELAERVAAAQKKKQQQKCDDQYEETGKQDAPV